MPPRTKSAIYYLGTFLSSSSTATAAGPASQHHPPFLYLYPSQGYVLLCCCSLSLCGGFRVGVESICYGTISSMCRSCGPRPGGIILCSSRVSTTAAAGISKHLSLEVLIITSSFYPCPVLLLCFLCLSTILWYDTILWMQCIN